jgi:hypothetical protein
VSESTKTKNINAKVLSFASKKDGRRVNTETTMYVLKFRQLIGQNNVISFRSKFCKVQLMRNGIKRRNFIQEEIDRSY